MPLVERQRQPDFLELLTTTTVSITVENAGVVQIPGASVYTLLDSAGATVVTSAGTIANGTASYAVTAANLTGEAHGDNFKSRWTLTIDGTSEIFEREAFVVNRKPRCPYTLTDMVRAVSAFSGDYELPPGKTSHQDYIDEAFDHTISRLIASGEAVHEVTSWYGVREYVKRVSLMGAAVDLMVNRSGASKWVTLWEALAGPEEDPRSAEFAWKNMTAYRMDRDQDSIPDSDGASESRPGSFVQDPSAPTWRGF